MDQNCTIIFLSEQKTVFEELQDYLASINSCDIPCFIDTTDQLEKCKTILKNCTLMICAPGANPLLLDLAAQILEYEPGFIPLILINSGSDSVAMFRDNPSLLRVTGAFELKNGWDNCWNSILELQQVWQTPVMHSRIEEVSPGDVLQMIGINQWTSIVRLDGLHVHTTPDNIKNSASLKGSIVFNCGIPQCAWSTHNEGPEAIWELLSLSRGTLDVIRRPWGLLIKNINSQIDEIIISYAVNVDESPSIKKIATPRQGVQNSWLNAPAKSTIDPFWKNNRALIYESIIEKKQRLLPLRWMRSREIDRLVATPEKKMFLLFTGNADFIDQLLVTFTGTAQTVKLANHELPVIRAGRFSGTIFYIIAALSFDSAIRPLAHYPQVIVADTGSLTEQLQATVSRNCSSVFIVSPSPDDIDTTIVKIDESETCLFGHLPIGLNKPFPVTEIVETVLCALSENHPSKIPAARNGVYASTTR